MIRLLIVDDQSIFRPGLKSYFATQDDVAVVGEAVNGLDAIALAETLMPETSL